MKNLIITFILVFSFIIVGCSSNTANKKNQEQAQAIVQKGDAKVGAKEFTSSIYSKYEENDAEAIERIITEYYDFYKDQHKENVKAFMMAVKEDWEPPIF